MVTLDYESFSSEVHCELETITASNFPHFLSSPTVVAASPLVRHAHSYARTSRLQSRSYAYLFYVLPLGFSRKKETAQSQKLSVLDEKL